MLTTRPMAWVNEQSTALDVYDSISLDGSCHKELPNRYILLNILFVPFSSCKKFKSVKALKNYCCCSFHFGKNCFQDLCSTNIERNEPILLLEFCRIEKVKI